MADAKKSTTSKKKPTTAKTKTTTKPKAATARKTAATPAATPKKRVAAPKVAQSPSTKQPFMSMQPTRETTYWLIFSLIILALGIWVLTLTIKINDIYDQIQSNDSALMISTPSTHERADKAE